VKLYSCFRWSLLVLSVNLPVQGDVCRDLTAGPPEGVDYLRKPSTAAFRISVKPGSPAFRITIHPLLFKWPEKTEKPVHAGDIEVADCRDGRRLQSLTFTAWQPIDFGATFKAEDINFDGHLDFSVLTEFASKWGSRHYWVYDAESRVFVENRLARELSENCLGTEWHGGCWKANFIEFDAAKHEIRANYLIGAGLCGSPTDRYRVENNRPVAVHAEAPDVTPNGCTVTVSDLVQGAMRVTSVRRFNARGRLIK